MTAAASVRRRRKRRSDTMADLEIPRFSADADAGSVTSVVVVVAVSSTILCVKTYTDHTDTNTLHS